MHCSDSGFENSCIGYAYEKPLENAHILYGALSNRFWKRRNITLPLGILHAAA
jgi:hypothetical protein